MNLHWRRIYLPQNWNNVIWICHVDKIHGSKWSAVYIICHWMGCNMQTPNWNVMLYVKCENSGITIFMMMQSGNLCSNKFKWWLKTEGNSISTRAISAKITKSTFVFRHSAYQIENMVFRHSNHLHSNEKLTYSLTHYQVPSTCVLLCAVCSSWEMSDESDISNAIWRIPVYHCKWCLIINKHTHLTMLTCIRFSLNRISFTINGKRI